METSRPLSEPRPVPSAPSPGPGARAPAWKVRAGRGLLFLVALVLFSLSWMSWKPVQFGPELEESWHAVLHWAFAERMRVGVDWVFTYGPWGFLGTDTYYPPTYPLLLLGQAGWCVAAALAADRFVAACFPRRLAGVLWLLALVWAGLEAGFLLPLLALALVRLPGRATWVRTDLLALGAALALLSQVKFSYCLACLGVVSLLGVADLVGRRLPWLGMSFVAGFAAAWACAGQRFTDLPAYFSASVELTRGYTGAMALWGPQRFLVEFLLAAGLAVVALAGMSGRADRVGAIASAAGLAGLTFIVFKAAYVRDDALHERTGHAFLLTLPLICLPVALAWRRAAGATGRAPSPSHIAVAASAAACLVGVWVALVRLHFLAGALDALTTWNGQQEDRAVEACLVLTGQSNLAGDCQARRVWMAKALPLPADLDTVDVMPFRQGLVLAHDWRYDPRPVFQSYSAYTPRLAGWNAEFWRGGQAPPSVLFQVDTIDGRLPSLDDGPSWPELLSRYQLRERTGTFQILRRSAAPREYSLAPVAAVSTRFGEEVPVPDAGGWPVWARVEIEPNAAGRAAAFFFKIPMPYVVINGASGYRMPAEMARAGFLLSPLVRTTDEFAALARDPSAGTRVRSVRFLLNPPAPSERFYRPEIRVTFESLHLSAGAGRPGR